MKKDKIKKISAEDVKMKARVPRNIGFVFLLNLIFAAVESIGCILTNSVALFSGAINDLGDSLTIGVAYIFEKKSSKLSDENYSYGYLKYSMIGSLVTSFLLILGASIIIYNAIPRLFERENVNIDAMIIFAIFGIIINCYATYKTAKTSNLSEKNICLTMLGDIFCWLIFVIGCILMKSFDLLIIDPILSILFAMYILYHVYKHMKNIYNLFMEKVPTAYSIQTIENKLKEEFKDIIEVNGTHIWSVDGINNYLSTHILLGEKITGSKLIDIKNDIKTFLVNLKFNNTTIEFDSKTPLKTKKEITKK